MAGGHAFSVEDGAFGNSGVLFLSHRRQIPMQVNGVPALAGCPLRPCSSRRCFAFVLGGCVLVASDKSLFHLEVGLQELGSRIVRGQRGD